MTGKEIRKKFLDFFEKRGHMIMPSASLIPHNDPSILWTAAGMVPFKPFFTGQAKPEAKRIATCQKCLRTPDIEEVGKTARHHTFFEMLGNFSFGDYFKEEAINWAWEFVTEVLKLDKEKLWITVYQDDDEAFEIWNKQVGVPSEKILRMGKDTNYWEIGVGPCGPCSEIYIDLGEHRGCGKPDCKVGCECDRFLEIWNLVFIQYFRDENGNYTPLKSKGVDTGMGLERIASVLQNVPTNFDTDLFKDIINFAASLINIEYGKSDKHDLALKIIADHARAVTFAIGDGALPSNEGRGYVIRRLIRRAVRFVYTLTENKAFSLKESLKSTESYLPCIYKIAGAVIDQMKDAYPELEQKREQLEQKREQIEKVILLEEKRFLETLKQGMELLSQLIARSLEEKSAMISGYDAFKLYDTYGFPLELTREIAAEHGLSVDEERFKAALDEQRSRSRSARQETKYLTKEEEIYQHLKSRMGETKFVGYDEFKTKSKLIAILKDGIEQDFASADEKVEVILDVTPFYAESGGQVSDHGIISGKGFEIEITSVHKPVENFIVHVGKVKKGTVRTGSEVEAAIEVKRRYDIMRNHSAAHLLHQALKDVLGQHVNQAGSLIEPRRLRFDFTHYSALSKEELEKIEDLVNEMIFNNLPVEIFETTLDKAKAMGSAALFDEKYGNKVRIVKMGNFSLELCGGTHVRFTSEIGVFKLVSESSISAGVRRVEAVTGRGVLEYLKSKEKQVLKIADALKAKPGEVIERVQALQKNIIELEKNLEALKKEVIKQRVSELLGQVYDLNGVKVLTAVVSVSSTEDLKQMSDMIKEKLTSGIIVLGAAVGKKASLITVVTKDLLDKGLHAGK
ncbi:alanine--tRNA ligase, partial [Peptococcaceae bacterium]|nr:alanine--tRNA ligase [Peptococcaceae bacterium]